ncbi:MAG: FtsX-like permease family protein [Clostridium sp.]
MNFSSMILKNIRYNIKNYTAYLLGNSIIQCILFMFLTLIFSSNFMEAKEFENYKANFISVVILMLAFSLAFIIYTSTSFTKYRGKEFGVYFTIGLTSKEIIKILCYENFIISLLSFFISSITGSIFSKLFHMGIGKVLKINNIEIEFSIKAYLTIFLVSFCIFIIITAYQIWFLRRNSIVYILKSKVKKDTGSTSLVLGIIGIILFIISFIIFYEVINQRIEVDSNIVLPASIIGIMISVYLIIGFSMTVIVRVLRKFKGIYNNNILFINSIAHRFKAYRTVLYVVTLMVSGAMIFISMGYGVYKETNRQIDSKYPYDIGFIVNNNQINNNNIKSFILNNIGEVNSYFELEGLNIPNIRVYDGECLWRCKNMLVISERNYTRLCNEELNLKQGEILQLSIEKMGSFVDAGFMLDLSKKGMDRQVQFDDYISNRDEGSYLYVPKENKRFEEKEIVNVVYNKSYNRIDTIVVNNDDYEMMKGKLGDESITYDILINLKGSLDFEGKEKLSEYLGKEAQSTLTIKSDMLDEAIKENGFMLFIFSFLGMMFLIGSGAVLYFKTIIDVYDDRERAKQLVRVGLTHKEIRRLSMKELGAVFLLPPVLAIVCTGMLLSILYNIIKNGEYMWKNTLYVFGVYLIIQVIFYFITFNKYKKQIMKGV